MNVKCCDLIISKYNLFKIVNLLIIRLISPAYCDLKNKPPEICIN